MSLGNKSLWYAEEEEERKYEYQHHYVWIRGFMSHAIELVIHGVRGVLIKWNGNGNNFSFSYYFKKRNYWSNNKFLFCQMVTNSQNCLSNSNTNCNIWQAPQEK